MARRRWLLVVLSLLSLFMLASAGVGLTYSVPTGDGERSVVVPIADPTALPVGAEGAILASGEREGTFPSSAKGVTLERALAYVESGADGVIVVERAPHPDGPTDLAIDVFPLAGGRAGWIVKADDAREPRFAAPEMVLGQYVGPTTTSWLVLLFATSLAGFLAPLIVLVLTHKGAGRKGAPPGTAPLICRECRAPLEKGATFCARCGAWRDKEADA